MRAIGYIYVSVLSLIQEWVRTSLFAWRFVAQPASETGQRKALGAFQATKGCQAR